jgi:hypothetical protein
MAMWQATYDQGGRRHGDDSKTKKYYSMSCGPDHHRFSLFLPTAGLLGLCRRDLLSALVSAGCNHLAIKILEYLDSQSLLAASLVCTDWQQFLLDCFYATPRFRNRVYRAIFEQNNELPKCRRTKMSKLTFSLALARAAIVDVAVDDDLNLFALAMLAGRPHVMSCSLFTQVSVPTMTFSPALSFRTTRVYILLCCCSSLVKFCSISLCFSSRSLGRQN